MFSNSPMGIASAVTGLPQKKSATRRGRKPSGKPGANHLAQLQKAHGSGDFSGARTHALNYAKATMKSALDATSMAGQGDADSDNALDGIGSPPAAAAPSVPTVPKAPAMPKVPSANPRLALAKLAMSRRKPA